MQANNHGALYRHVNQRIRRREPIGALIGDNGEVVTSDVIKANMFNEYYATVWVIDDGNIYTCPHIQLTSIVETVIFNEHDILVAANKLKPNLSAGPYGLPPLLFKRLRFSLARPLHVCLLSYFLYQLANAIF